MRGEMCEAHRLDVDLHIIIPEVGYRHTYTNARIEEGLGRQ
jgi:hypothetical protein